MSLLPTLNFEYYFTEVQSNCGWQEEPFPPVTQLSDWKNATPLQRRVKRSIEDTLRLLNNDYWLAFTETEYLMTTVAGQLDYDLTIAPYNQIFWRVNRMGRNSVIRTFDDIPLIWKDYTDIDAFRPDFTLTGLPIFVSGFSKKLRIYPKPTVQLLKVRYYPTAIATDSVGNLQNKLVLPTDLTTLMDEWETVLVAGAVYRLRLTDRNDAKTEKFKEIWEEQRAILAEMMKVGGEDSPRKFEFMNMSPMSRMEQRVFPFGTKFP